MYLIFENELGSVKMSGGGEDIWRIISIEGLEPVEYRAETVTMPGREGQVTSSLASMPRTISIKGDIRSKGNKELLSQAAQIMSREGYIKIRTDSVMRKIKARLTALVPERAYGDIRGFVMQFICDDPFFTDYDEQHHKVRTVKKNLYKAFTIGDGIVLSSGSSSAIICNKGVIATEPVIKITNLNPTLTGSNITITNVTTGKALVINAPITSDYVLTIDIPQRKVMLNDDVRFDILSPDSFLSDFMLEPGNNELSIDTGSSYDRLDAVCSYTNRYTEAMV